MVTVWAVVVHGSGKGEVLGFSAQGSGAVRYDRGTRKFTATMLSAGQREANRSRSAMRAPGERANAELKNWRILRKIRSSPAHASLLVNAVQTVIITS